LSQHSLAWHNELVTTLTPKLWNRDEYYRLEELGFFRDQRVELLYGEIVRMSPQNKPHALALSRLNTLMVLVYRSSHYVRVQLPLDLGTESQPEPDIAVVPISLVENSDPHPPTADLVVEVAETSLLYDRKEKAALYAGAGVPTYWLVNLREEVLEVYTRPEGKQYSESQILTPTESVAFPGSEEVLKVCSIFQKS